LRRDRPGKKPVTASLSRSLIVLTVIGPAPENPSQISLLDRADFI
jgi:hypothetical protein